MLHHHVLLCFTRLFTIVPASKKGSPEKDKARQAWMATTRPEGCSDVGPGPRTGGRWQGQTEKRDSQAISHNIPQMEVCWNRENTEISSILRSMYRIFTNMFIYPSAPCIEYIYKHLPYKSPKCKEIYHTCSIQVFFYQSLTWYKAIRGDDSSC